MMTPKTKEICDVLANQRNSALDQVASLSGDLAEARDALDNVKVVTDAALAAKCAELETTVAEKDAQIVEQSRTIVSLRSRVAELEARNPSA